MQSSSDNDNENKAVTMVHIGMAYNGNKEFALALKYLLSAYNMYCRILPEGHPVIGWTTQVEAGGSDPVGWVSNSV